MGRGGVGCTPARISRRRSGGRARPCITAGRGWGRMNFPCWLVDCGGADVRSRLVSGVLAGRAELQVADCCRGRVSAEPLRPEMPSSKHLARPGSGRERQYSGFGGLGAKVGRAWSSGAPSRMGMVAEVPGPGGTHPPAAGTPAPTGGDAVGGWRKSCRASSSAAGGGDFRCDVVVATGARHPWTRSPYAAMRSCGVSDGRAPSARRGPGLPPIAGARPARGSGRAGRAAPP